jgi:U3 small nucleolar RNA-associated protein 21
MKKAYAKGVKPEELKLPPVVAFDAEEIRENDWDNVVTCHWGHSVAQTWRLQNKSIGRHKLKPQYAPANSSATVATVSHCGNFALIGYLSGHVEIFNIQSGLHRGCIAHDGAVKGIVIDAISQGVVTRSADKTLKFWTFKSKHHISTDTLEEAVCQMVYHKESLMPAVALDDFTIHVMDTETKRIVRTFKGHSNRILDMAV